MSIQQVLLSNTFNEFRITTNQVINAINGINPSSGVLVANSITSNANLIAPVIISNTVFSTTGQIELPAGSTGDRGSSNVGSIRYNTDLDTFEGYGALGWGAIGGGGGATGGNTDQVFFENEQVVNNSYSITAGKNAMSVGPITIANGITLEVPSGSRLVIL
jgi:hypothetical protein